jgi:4-amino-4-deoxy-L-arabinose transferase-like glycosyltransferase
MSLQVTDAGYRDVDAARAATGPIVTRHSSAITYRLRAWAPLIGLVVVAFAVRWPHLWYVPQFTDETFDGLVAYGIYEGKRPLTGVNAYTGAFHYYVQAGLYWLFGPSVYSPRLLVMVLGVGAVAATYLLGAEIGSRAVSGADDWERGRAARWAGLVAGGLLATSATHVLANSHLAWPHCTVLLYLTLAFWLVERALRLRSGPSLVAGGLAFGLAQQQHPTMVLLWPVLIGYVAWRGRDFFRSRWAYLAVGAFLIGISPLIMFNARTGFETLRESEEQRAGYEQGRDKDWSYRGRADEILLTSARLTASAIDPRPEAADYLRDPSVVAYTALAVAGLVVSARLGVLGPPLAVLAFLLLLPLFPASHDNLPRQGRYLMPLLPFAFAGIGGLVIWTAARLRGRASARMLLVLASVLLVAYPLVPLVRHYDEVLSAGETNARYFITLEAVERLRGPEEVVLLDPSLQRDRTGAAGTALRTFDFLLTVRQLPHVTLERSADRIERRVAGPTALVIADERPGSATTSANAATWRAEEIPNAAPGGFTIWRLTRQ